jgi:ribosomal protein S18 acetylase RimI-like enzyme
MIRLLDLRQVSARQMEPLFAEEQAHWLEHLLWDYRPSIQLISKFIDLQSLAGYAAFAGSEPAGYGFYVMEEAKGLIGGLFVSPRFSATDTAARILRQVLETLRQVQGVERIEAQLMPFGAPLDGVLTAAGFSLHQRNFMLLPMEQSRLEPLPLRDGLRLEPWDDRWFEPCARLIQRAYAGHIDADINDQYRTEAGAMRFLKNIVILPGCGQFQQQASYVVRQTAASEELAGVVLASCVSHGVGHTTQICVLPEFRKLALGRRLMAASIQALRAARYHALTLTVTARNERAVRLYERIGFHTVKTFRAAVWQARH